MSISYIPSELVGDISITDLESFAASHRVHIDAHETKDFLLLLQHDVKSMEALLEMPDYKPLPTKHTRGGAHFIPKSNEDNRLGAWAYQVDVKCFEEDNNGLLKGGSVVLKDNVALAGVPCLVGTEVFSNWIPDTDATIVSRILNAGGNIKGKSVCENLCMTPASNSAATGCVENPFAIGFTSGGSSSGTAALIANGEIVYGIGADQGGSIRIPAAHCGLVGLKATFGLIPYTGCVSGEFNIDHVGPIARTVSENARLLQAIAGYDGIDDRAGPGCPSPATLPSYIDAALPGKLDGIRVGILAEAFQIELLSQVMATKVRDAANKFTALGAHVEDVSIPFHKYSGRISQIFTRCAGANVQSGRPAGRRGLYLNDLTQKCFPQTAEAAAKSYFTVRNVRIVGEYAWENYPAVYGKSVNLARQLRDSYDEALRKYDVLVLPVVNYPARRHADPKSSPLIQVEKFSPFNVTGHPALSLPIGLSSPVEADILTEEDRKIRLPIGLQIVGKYFDEATIYRVASAWEKAYNWKDF